MAHAEHIFDYEDCLEAGGVVDQDAAWPHKCYLDGEYFVEKPNMVASFKELKLKGQMATDDEVITCEEMGGEIKKIGMLRFEKCVLKYPDFGKECRDGSDCLGSCVLKDNGKEPQRGLSVVGQCEEYNNSSGCRSLVNGGVYEGTLCLD